MLTNGDRFADPRHSRSRSPHRYSRSERTRRRSRSSHSPHGTRKRPSNTPTKPLPFNARPILKHDLPYFRPMFALYLDIQKHLALEEMAEDEVRGRWKSFVGKW
jgi:peroxin-14